MARKFSPQRLFLLVKRTVLILSFIFGLIGIIKLNQITFGGLSSLDNYCDKHYSSVPYSTCATVWDAEYKAAREKSGSGGANDLAIAIGLPTVFYIGIRLYRFLFPLNAGK